MALEPAGDVERFQRQRIFRWQSQAWGFRSSLIRLPTSPSRLYPERRNGCQRLFTHYRRRREYLLEKQSISVEGIYRRGRLELSAVGRNGPGGQSRSRCNPYILGRALCAALPSPVLDRRRSYQATHGWHLGNLPRWQCQLWPWKSCNAESCVCAHARSLSPHLDDRIVEHL